MKILTRKPILMASEKAVCEASHVIYHVDLQAKPQNEFKIQQLLLA